MHYLLFLAMLSPAILQAKDSSVLRKIDDQCYASLRNKHGAVLDIRVKTKAELLPAIQAYSGRTDLKSPWKKLSIKKISPTRALLPYRFLSPPFRKLFVQKLWPKDYIKGSLYYHHISFSHESLWSLASWFTGSGQNYKKIKKASRLKSDRLNKGQVIKIPVSLLFPFLAEEQKAITVKPDDPVTSFSTPLKAEEIIESKSADPIVSDPSGEKPVVEQPTEKPPEKKKPPVVKTIALNGEAQTIFEHIMLGRKKLSYGKDKQGTYAIYTLNKGEAIYSAIVVRFCGLVSGEDVNRVSKDIIKRNRIKDVTDMPVGKKLKIPYDYLIPEYKASNDSEYVEWLENMKAVKRVDTSIVIKDLAGVTIILDSGHGGRDTGAKKGNTWEDDLVYDILCRIKTILETKSGARVLPTINDPSVGYKPQNASRFTLDRDEVLNTNPKFSLKKNSTKLAVNMRWIFSNHHYSKIISQKKTGSASLREKVVFISLHADSLHSSLRGSMVYVPDARSYPKRRIHGPKQLKRYREYKNSSFLSSKAEMERAQALSTRFAGNFLSELKKRKLPVHRQSPIRSVIFRSPRSRPFVPAVLNYNRVPRRVLIEVCNLNNVKDRQLIKKPTYRQQIAEATVDALYTSFGAHAPLQVAKKSKK